MSFDRDRIAAAVAAKGRIARVVVAAVAGSAPREAGASVLVWADGQSGTIGGGTLEFEAVARARAEMADRLDRLPLGPALGQCCGGHVTLLTEVWDAARLNALGGDVVARPAPGGSDAMPLGIKRALAAARSKGEAPEPRLIDGWMVEPVSAPSGAIWIYGAGHVGRAIVEVLAPLPELAITWIDTGAERFPAEIPEGATQLVAANPADVVRYAPAHAEHYVLTYSHALDLELCHAILGHGFRAAGLIGSATKWARFQRRLAALGHGAEQIARIDCPIGDPSLGKHPQAIAIGIAARLLTTTAADAARKDGTA